MPLAAIEVVQAVYAAFAVRDISKVFALLSPEIEIVQSTELPWGGVYRGHDGARQFFTKLTAHLDSTLEIERLINAGEHIVAVGWTQGKVNATGATYRVAIAHIWKVRDGQVMQAQFLIDNPTMLTALAVNS